MYLDLSKKLDYYRGLVLQEYIKNGIYPDDNLLSSSLKRFDLGLSVLKEFEIDKGSGFNTDKYNRVLEQTHKDLEILYQVLYDIVYNKFQSYKDTIDLHLNSINDKVTEFKMRSLQEINSTALGETIYYKANAKAIVEHNTAYYLLGNVSLYNKAKIACFLNANNVLSDDIVFIFTNNITGESFYAPVYNNNQYSFIVPGDITYNDYYYRLGSNNIIYDTVKISLDTELSEGNKHIVFSGLGKVFQQYKNSNKYNIVPAPLNSYSNGSDDNCYYNFYIIGGNTVSFGYNKKPVSTSFNLKGNVLSLEPSQHISIECDKDFIFNMVLNSGSIYACQNKDVIIDKKDISIRNPYRLDDFLIREITNEENTTNFSVVARINNINSHSIEMNNITIKQLLTIA